MSNSQLASPDTLPRPTRKDVAIIGASASLPGAATLAQFRHNLISGTECVRQLPELRRRSSRLDPNRDYPRFGYLDRVDSFDYRFFEVSKRDAELMDPQQRLLLQLAYHAIEDAGYSAGSLAGTNTAVIVGTRIPDYYLLLPKELTRAAMVGNVPAMAAGRLSYHLDLRGPSITVDSACSTSLYALYAAWKMLINEEVDTCLVGGVSIVNQQVEEGARSDIGVLAPDGCCRPFDWRSSGTVGGEGGVVFLLKRLDAAVGAGDHVYAVIKGGAVNSDGRRSSGLTVPSHEAQAEVITAAWRQAGVSPSPITYLEAHGTGTRIGDPVEYRGMVDAHHVLSSQHFGFRVGSVKANIGHLDAAAGAAGVLRATLSLCNGELYPMANFQRLNPLIEAVANSGVVVQQEHEAWQRVGEPRRAGVSSFSLSGTNVHLVLEEPPAPEPRETAPAEVFLKLSARTSESLVSHAANVRQWLDQSRSSLDDLCFTLNVGRDDYPYRATVRADRVEALGAALENIAQKAPWKPASSSSVVLLLAEPDHAARVSYFGDELPEKVQLGVQANLTLAQRGLIAQCGLYRYLVNHGIAVSCVIGTGVGGLSKRVVVDDYPLGAALEEAKNLQPAPVNRERFRELVKSLDSSEVLYVAFSTTESLPNALERPAQTDRLVTLSDHPQPLALLLALYQHGLDVDWASLYERPTHHAGPRRVPAPLYPFADTSCWFVEETPATAASSASTESVPPEASGRSAPRGFRDRSDWTADENRVAALWWQVLKPEQLGLDDVFFEIGGHSMSALELIDEIQVDCGVSLTLDEFYAHPSVRELATLIASRAKADKSEPEGPELTHSAVAGQFVLSPTQEGVWIAAQLDTAQNVYNLPQACTIRGPVSVPALQRAFGSLAERHESLRTIFRSTPNGPRQEVLAVAELDLRVVDVRQEANPRNKVELLVRQVSEAAFALDRLPLFRVLLIRVEDECSVLALVLHHIIGDGWSMKLLLRDLILLYQEQALERSAPPAPKTTFADYVLHHEELAKAGALDKHREYWRQALAQYQPTPLPFRREDVNSSPTSGRVEFSLVPTKAVREFAAAEKVTVFTVLLAAVASALYSTGVTNDVCLGVDLAGRNTPEVQEIVGLFVNTVPIRIELAHQTSFRDVLAATKRRLLEAHAHQDYPSVSMSRDLLTANQKRSLGGALFDMFVSFQNPADFSEELELLKNVSWNIEPFEVHPPGNRFNLEFMFSDRGDDIRASVYFNTNLFRRSTVELFALRFVQVLETSVNNPSAALAPPASLATTPTEALVPPIEVENF